MLHSAELVNETDTSYHSQDILSRSRLWDLKKSPGLFHARYIAKSLPPFQETASMRIGTAAHLLALEPHEYTRRVLPAVPRRPEGANGRAKRDSDAYALFKSWQADCEAHAEAINDHPDPVVLTDEEIRNVVGIVDAWMQHPVAGELLQTEGMPEQSIRARVFQTAVRMRLDKLIVEPNRVTVLDLKTSNDCSPRAFVSSCVKYGYLMQAAMYLDAAQAIYPDRESRFILAVAESRPYHEAVCYEFAPDDIYLAREQYLSLVLEYEERVAKDDWTHPRNLGIHTLEVPPWAWT
jgi:hypothetical protein